MTPIHTRLYAAIDHLFDDEIEVLMEVAEAMKRGQDDYGPLDLDSDCRNFFREALDEDRDWLAYRAMQIIQDRRREKDRY